MNSLIKKIIRFLAAEDGPTAVEYAMMILLVFLGCLSAVTLMGESTMQSFQQSNTSIQNTLDTSK